MIDGADAEWMHGLMDYGRRSPGHDFPVSRDWEDIDCKAVGCRYNLREKCMVPSRCKISDDGRCTGFEVKPMETNKKPDGD
jgi:hypothetical protein